MQIALADRAAAGEDDQVRVGARVERARRARRSCPATGGCGSATPPCARDDGAEREAVDVVDLARRQRRCPARRLRCRSTGSPRAAARTPRRRRSRSAASAPMRLGLSRSPRATTRSPGVMSAPRRPMFWPGRGRREDRRPASVAGRRRSLRPSRPRRRRRAAARRSRFPRSVPRRDRPRRQSARCRSARRCASGPARSRVAPRCRRRRPRSRPSPIAQNGGTSMVDATSAAATRPAASPAARARSARSVGRRVEPPAGFVERDGRRERSHRCDPSWRLVRIW